MSLPLPNNAIQHTRATIALYTVLSFLKAVESVTGKNHTRINEQIKRIRRWSDECAKSTIKKKMSAGGKRSFFAVADVFGKYAMGLDASDNQAEVDCYCALVRASGDFVLDAICTSHDYTRENGTIKREWNFLHSCIMTFCNMLEAESPNLDMNGTELYLKAAEYAP